MRTLAALFLALSLSAAAQSDNPKNSGQTTNIGDSDKNSAHPTAQKTPSPSTQKEKPQVTDKPQKKEKPRKRLKSKDKPGKKGKPTAQDASQPPDPLSTGTFNGLKFRSIGPAVIAGRIVSIAVNPENHAHFYIGAASGGVWKTDNDGISWTPVFENEASFSIGTVVLDPNDPNVVWVGTGENNSQRSVSYGDGVYRSEDGGKSWTNLGLKHSEHIARIVIDPRDSKVVYVAAQGPLWGPGGDRGLFKTIDGGKTWKNVLSISQNTGVTDVVMDPRDPDVLYAASYQRRRHVWTLIDGGPESAIYKSTDAGATWTKLKSGIPTVDLGRIGLAIAPSDPDTVYATIEAADGKGGIFRSTDRGATWERRNPFEQTGMYYATLFVDPRNSERIYVMNVVIHVSDDGGKTLHPMSERSKHGDNHVIYIDPDDNAHYLVGSDGGVYESYDRGETWGFKQNLPIGQFYDVAVDDSKPFYYVYGGTQDNSNWGGPSRTMRVNGSVNTDWFFTQGGDGFHSAIDPEDPNTVYAEYQYGALVRYDRRTGERLGIQPQEGKGDPPLRWYWDSPIVISSHDHKRLYFAANKVFRSDDRGDSWRAISGDLTRQIDRDSLPVMGKIWGPDAVAKNASTSFYGNIITLAESPQSDGTLYVGTDDGLIQTTQDGGATWHKIEHFPGVPDRTFVSRIVASNFDGHTVFAAFDNHKNADFKPYLLRSTDGGATWTSIAATLPENGPVYAIAQDTVNPNLLFVGTEFGLFFSIDGGGKWIQLKGGLPTIPVRDIAIQKRESDLVLATFGRGFYILDDLTPLRLLKAEQLSSEAELLPVRNAMMYVEQTPFGGSKKGWFGENFYVAENPPYGANFTYYLKEKFKTPKELRQQAEKDAIKDAEKSSEKKMGKGPARKSENQAADNEAGKAAQDQADVSAYPTLKYPSTAELHAEAETPAPELWLVVRDASGNIVRRIPAANTPGFNRAAWDLRYPPIVLPPDKPNPDSEDDAPRGRFALPGRYTVRLAKNIGGQWSDLGEPQTFDVYVDGADQMSPADSAALAEFQQKVLSLDRAVGASIETANDYKGRMKKIEAALDQTPADTAALVTQSDQIDARLNSILTALRGDEVLRHRQDATPPSINDRINNIESDEWFSTARPTQTDVDSYSIAAGEFTTTLSDLKSLIAQVTSIEQQMERLGSPYTPGRLPDWSPK